MFIGVVNVSFIFILLIGSFLCILSLVMSSSRFLNCLMVLENMNVLLLVCCLLSSILDSRSCFVTLLVMFTIEAALCLVVLVRVWSFGGMIGVSFY